jgi:hypothetical protein
MTSKKEAKKQASNVTKWLKALRSGEYRQTKEVLKSDEGFCCLGVLCDVVDRKGWEDHDLVEASYFYIFDEDDRDESLIPQRIFSSWTGITGAVPDPRTETAEADEKFHDDFLGSMLAGLNDESDWTFEEIADFVEKKAKEAGVLY